MPVSAKHRAQQGRKSTHLSAAEWMEQRKQHEEGDWHRPRTLPISALPIGSTFQLPPSRWDDPNQVRLLGGTLRDVNSCAVKVDAVYSNGKTERSVYWSTATPVTPGPIPTWDKSHPPPPKAASSGGSGAAKGSKAAPAAKKPGVIAVILETLRSATEKKPASREAILAILIDRFPERAPAAMKSTVSSQVPSGLKAEKGLICSKNEKGYWL